MMHKIRLINILLRFFTLKFWICWCQQPLLLSVKEETRVGYVLGNINDYVIANFYGIDQYDVSVIDKYFAILPNKNVVVQKRIDLENFCMEAELCCGTSQCVVTISVLINTRNTMRNRFNIHIEVVDINDNMPTFKIPVQMVGILEDSKIGTSVSLDGGTDADVSQTNQIQFYKFEEPTKTFDLDSSELASIYLVLQKPVDYERERTYRAKLSACDNATSCTHQQVVINIQDVNDNFPKFEKRHYKKEILETIEIGSVLLTAHAVDLDGPQFNKTKYSFYNNRDVNLQKMFKVDPGNGNVVLLSKLSAFQRPSYGFKISAVDVSMSFQKDIADVVIIVKDINDNKPIIETMSSKVTVDKNSFVMNISENERPQILLSMKVSDADLGDNAKVVCHLKDPSSSLELKFNEPDIYEINSIRNFDYEQETQIKAIFECRDSGVPPQSSYKSIKVNIEDVNEFPPEFEQPQFHSSVKENTGPGETVLTVAARDKDGAAVLRYSLEESATKFFAINPNNGVIKTTSFAFDREEIALKFFRVTVTDSISNPRSADATVEIIILDENDNDPVFVPSSLRFSISENKPLKSKLFGNLLANDADKDVSNSYLSFALLDTFNSDLKKCERSYFKVKFNGEIETLSVLDREKNPNFTLTVEVRDSGQPPRHSKANVTVVVLDVNDNSPMWVYPRQPENKRQNLNMIPMLNLTENTERFFFIMKLKAYDPDEDEAGRVSYLLINHNEYLFSLNDTSGELLTEKSPLPHGQYQLQLRAVDHGSPPRSSDSRLLINVVDSGRESNINLTIIIGMVAITAVISIFLIVAIICVRRRPRFHQLYLAPSMDVVKEQSNQYYPTNQWMYGSPEENILPPLSDKESCIYLPTSYFELQDPVVLQSLGGSRPTSRLDYPFVLQSSQPGNSEAQFMAQGSQNMERAGGTLRSNNGQYCSINAATSGIIINGKELDGDSADSGKGASEVDLRLQHHLTSRNYPTMPFPHHSIPTASFGYQGSLPGPQYYPVNGNPRPYDSRFLTLHPSQNCHNRRGISPTCSSNNQCQCFMLPEDDVIQAGQDSNDIPMTTFVPQSACNFKPPNHDQNCLYRNNSLSPAGTGYYSNCPYIQETNDCLSASPTPFKSKDYIANDVDALNDNKDGEKVDSYNSIFEGKSKNAYPGTEQINQESSLYTLGLSNC